MIDLIKRLMRARRINCVNCISYGGADSGKIYHCYERDVEYPFSDRKNIAKRCYRFCDGGKE